MKQSNHLPYNCCLAQLGEQETDDQEVMGSNPTGDNFLTKFISFFATLDLSDNLTEMHVDSTYTKGKVESKYTTSVITVGYILSSRGITQKQNHKNSINHKHGLGFCKDKTFCTFIMVISFYCSASVEWLFCCVD